MALPAGEHHAAFADHGLITVFETENEIVCLRVTRRLLNLRLRCAGPAKGDVFGDGAREQEDVLFDLADLRAQVRFLEEEVVVLRSIPTEILPETSEPWWPARDPLGNADGVDLEPSLVEAHHGDQGCRRALHAPQDPADPGATSVEATIEACSLRFRPILMTGLAFVCGVLPMAIATGAGGASQQALGTSVMGGMIAVVILALLMVPVFFVSVQRTLGGDREKTEEKEVASELHGPPAPARPAH